MLALAVEGAYADVVISTQATQNMTCSGGVCAPTAAGAVLNRSDLATPLAAGHVTVTTTGSGVQAEARATAVSNPELKARWLNVAACWREMAAQLDRLEKD